MEATPAQSIPITISKTAQRPEPSLVVTPWVTQASILIPLVIFIGYVWALTHEIGFCEYFYIPSYLIALTPTSVLATTVLYILLLVMLFLLISATFYVEKFYIWLASNTVLCTVCTIPFLLLLGILFNATTFKMNVILVSTEILGIIHILVEPLFIRAEEASYLTKLIVSIKMPYRKSTQGISLSERLPLSRYWDRIIVFIILMSLLAAYGSYILGHWEAQGRVPFHVITQSPDTEVAVIRSYGEYLYAVPITRRTNEHKAQFERKLFIVKLSDIKNPLSYENIGPLETKP